MRPRFAAALITSLFLLSGCSSLGALGAASTGTLASVAPDDVNVAKRVLTASHIAHKAAAELLTVAATSNLCHSACAASAKIYLDQSEAVLIAGDKLVVLGDAPGIEAKVAAAMALIAQAQSLIGKK